MTTEVTIGHGSKFLMGDHGSPEVFQQVAEVTSITPPAFMRDTPDATHMQSPDKFREFIPGLRDPGECSITINFIPGSPTQDAMMLQFTSDAIEHFRIEYPNLETWDFSGYCVGFAPEVPLDGKMSATCRFKLTGKPVYVTVP